MKTCQLCGIEMADWFIEEVELVNITVTICKDCSYCVFQHVDELLQADKE